MDTTTQVLYGFSDSSINFEDYLAVSHQTITSQQYNTLAAQLALPTTGGYSTSKFIRIDLPKHTERQSNLKYRFVNQTQYLNGVSEQDIVKTQEYSASKTLFYPKLKYMYVDNVTPYVAKTLNLAQTYMTTVLVFIPCAYTSSSLPDCAAIYSNTGDPLATTNRNITNLGATVSTNIGAISKNTMENTYKVLNYTGWSQDAIDHPDVAYDSFIYVNVYKAAGMSSSDFEDYPLNVRLIAVADNITQAPTPEAQTRVTSIVTITKTMIDNAEVTQ